MEKSLLDRQSALANQMMTLGQGQVSASKPALDAAMHHYMTAAMGSRSAMDQQLAPERAAMADTARGTQRGLEAHMGAGAQRDEAMADLARRQYGASAMLPTQARNDAVGKLAEMGQQGMNRGMSMFGQAGGALSGQSGQAVAEQGRRRR